MTETPTETPAQTAEVVDLRGPLTLEALGKKILASSQLTAAELLQLPLHERYEHAGVAWELGKPPPGNEEGVAAGTAPALMIVALFTGDQHDTSETHSPGDVRAYVMRGDAQTDDGPGKREYRCYTMNRLAPTILYTRMNRETFIEDIGGEWYDLAVLRGVVEETDDDDE